MIPRVTVDIPSDGEEDDDLIDSPGVQLAKRRRDERVPLLIVDTPQKEIITPFVVPETPLSCPSDVSIVKCTQSRSFSGLPADKTSGLLDVICLDSDNEPPDIFGSENSKGDQCLDSFPMVEGGITSEVVLPKQVMNIGPDHEREVTDTDCQNTKVPRKKQTKKDKTSLNEERKIKREQEKLRREALKAEAAKMKKLQKEKERWEKGKLAIKSIVVQIDAKVVEMGLIGGSLLSRLAEKGLEFHITSNPIENSLLWKMNVPDQIAQFSSKGSDVPYILFVYEAEAFCNMVTDVSLIDHVHRVQLLYPEYTTCYCTNKLMSFISKREQGQYKNLSNANSWKRPPIEEVLSMLSTHFYRVHSRQCLDEAEVAEHIVGLTCSLAYCHFRLKALIAIPKVQPRFAVAIWKKYPTMRCLLDAYMDPCRSVHEKEFLLKDLTTESLLGNEDRRVGEMCSKRVYRILMAQSGSIKTDDVEDGADLFKS